MGDPLSVAGSCIAVATAATKLSETITAFICTVREARGELAATKMQLTNLCTVLDLLQYDTKRDQSAIPDMVKPHLIAMLGRCNKDIIELEVVVEKHNSQVGPLKWAYHGKKAVLTLNRNIETHIRTLQIALGFSSL